jgi:hypothetical protein
MVMLKDEARDVIAPELQRELLKHEGRWVAISDDDLIAVGDTRNEVAEAAVAQGAERPLLYFVPRDGHRSMFF